MKSCLIIEDMDATARVTAARVAAAFPGIDVGLASTLAAARGWLRSNPPPALVLLDVGLPDGEGTELLLDGALGAGSLVIVHTVFGDDEHLFQALRAGAHGYLLKEDSEADFLTALSGIANGRPPLSAPMAQRLMVFFRADRDTPGVALSPREREVLTLIARGLTVRQAAQALALTENTIASYLKTVYQKLHVGTRAAAALEAIRLGLVRPPGR